MIDFNIPLAGLDRATTSLNRTASRIAKAGFPEGGAVDLSAEMVQLIQARRGFETNVKVIQADNQMTKSLFNIIG